MRQRKLLPLGLAIAGLRSAVVRPVATLVAIASMAFVGATCGSSSAGSSPPASASAGASASLPAGVVVLRQEAVELGTRKAGATNVKRSGAKLLTFADIEAAGVDLTPPPGPDSTLVWLVGLTATFTAVVGPVQGYCFAEIDAKTGDVYETGCNAATDWPLWFDALKDRAP